MIITPRTFKYVGKTPAIRIGGIVLKKGESYTVTNLNSWMLSKFEGRPDFMELKSKEDKQEAKEDTPKKDVSKQS